jgi:hypothetical protein
MNTIGYFFIGMVITLVVCLLTSAYLRPVLLKILIDLCGTEERGKFWMTFTNIILVALPLLSSLGFVPSTNPEVNIAYEIANQLKTNLFDFVSGLALVGFILLFFTASASRNGPPNKRDQNIG